jgi:hypothetical protein
LFDRLKTETETGLMRRTFNSLAFAGLLGSQAALLLVALLQCESLLDFVAALAGAVSSGVMSALLLHPANH